MKEIVKNKNSLIVVCLFLLAIVVRLVYFKDYVTFFYDQARDAVSAMEIWQGDPIKILGPSSDFPGLFHGPLYWYLISPFYYISHGNVYIVRLFLILLNSFGTIIIYKFTNELFKKKYISLTAAFLFAVSFEATQYGRWLSNPSLVPITSLISFWGLYKLIKGNVWGLPVLLVSWGLSVQLQLFMLYQLPIFIAIWLSTNGVKLPKANSKTILTTLLGTVIAFSSYVVSEIKFNFQGTRALLNFFKFQEASNSNLWDSLKTYFLNLANSFYFNIWGNGTITSKIFLCILILLSIHFVSKKLYKNQIILLLTWIASPFLAIYLQGPDTTYIMVGALSPLIILTSLLLHVVFKKKPIVIIFFLLLSLVGNMQLILNKNKEGEVLFDIQHKSLLGDQTKVVDWIYGEAKGKPFTLNTITEPLFINTRWAFLFNSFGNTKYKYMPYWWGEVQVDVPGSKIKFADWQETDLHFLIIEPSSGPNEDFIKAVKFLENQRSEIISKESFGVFTVEKRKINKIQRFTGTDAYDVIINTSSEELRRIE